MSASGKSANPLSGLGQHQIRLISGSILFVFVSTHLLNHALGLVSIDAMQAVREVRVAVTRSVPGSVILGLALLVHIVLALYKFAVRRTLRMSIGEGIQLVFGLSIPYFLFRHMIGTRLPHEMFGLDDDYVYALFVMWPGEAWGQFFLINVVWVHACIGLHFWLRLRAWYARVVWPLFAMAVLVPVLAYAGFAVAGRNIRNEYEFENPYTQEQVAFLYQAFDWGFWGAIGVVALVLVIRVVRFAIGRLRHRVRITYANAREIITESGPTLLDISRSWNVPHASVCGGRARCSTCRVRVLEGLDHLPAPGEQERKVLERVGAAPNVRLACQIAPSADISVATLLPAHRVSSADANMDDSYTWGVEQDVTVLFADLRGFTALSEDRYPYDVVFILNQYLGQMSTAIEDNNGYVDKFIGDGIMAIFGMGQPTDQGAVSALRAAKAMGGVLGALNKSLAADLPEPLRIGIGLHTGHAILGRVGVADSGASQRITALGDTVNTASRLEGSSKQYGAELVVSSATAIASGLTLEPDQNDRVSVKGKQTQLDILVFRRAIDVLND
ncbi:MAG: adenylate/guanylate cyclase domain-containing protein [Pseudomonadota bacterium]